MKFRTLIVLIGCAMLVCAARAYTSEEIVAESAKANAYFERVYKEFLDRHPQIQSQLGIKKDYDKWEDQSEAAGVKEFAINAANLAELKTTINYDALDHQTQLSYKLFERRAERQIEGYKWRLYNYPVNQMFGEHTGTPAFLIGIHRINDVKDAIISGAPFDSSSKESTLLEDFSKKVGALKEVDPATKDRLLAEAKDALLTSVKPAYDKLITELIDLEKSATDDDGAWKFANGVDFYNYALRETTTTDLTADQIHELGLKEVARIHDEMRGIMKKVNFSGDLAAFFKFVREDKQFYYPNTPEGKAAYLARSVEIIDTMRGRLDELFITKPKASIVVKAVEPFREKESGGAFYQRGTPDGSRPGTYYVNLYDMNAVPKYEMYALAFHEGIPGHHMQISIAQELTGIPNFRKFGGYTAYIEGWGLYCERIPKELGFYGEPYDDFGRLSMELWRAARLVVDTGLHAKKWTRQQTLDWLHANTPNTDRDILTETNRYIVLPSQATAYKIGMLKFLELRELAKKELGPKFDLREYHDVVLRDGALPLDVLEEVVRDWIAKKKSA